MMVQRSMSKMILLMAAVVLVLSAMLLPVQAGATSSSQSVEFKVYPDSASSYGSPYVKAETNQPKVTTIDAYHSANKQELNLIVLNKDVSNPLVGIFNVQGGGHYTSGKVMYFDRQSNTMKELTALPQIANNQFILALPPLTAYQIVLKSTTPPVGTGTGLKGEYFDNKDLTSLKTVRIDENVNFNWRTAKPDGAVNGDTFSVRWTGQVQPLYSETYKFHTVTDDGVRLWVNGQKIIDDWNIYSAKENTGTITLAAGQKYDIRLEYFENLGDAEAKLMWSSTSQNKQVIPQKQLYPASITGSGTGLKAQYYDSKNLESLKLTRTDAAVQFNWGFGAPDAKVDGETFSVRWSGEVQPLYTEKYTFHTLTDDGVRLWVNGKKLIDDWSDHQAKENSGTIELKAGQKYDIKMEYYEQNGEAQAYLMWSSASQSKQIIPQQQLYPAPSLPTAPTGLKAVAGKKEILLSWNAVADADAYEVKRSNRIDGPYTVIAKVDQPAYVDRKVSVGKGYYYVISAVNEAGKSGNSYSVWAKAKK